MEQKVTRMIQHARLRHISMVPTDLKSNYGRSPSKGNLLLMSRDRTAPVVVLGARAGMVGMDLLDQKQSQILWCGGNAPGAMVKVETAVMEAGVAMEELGETVATGAGAVYIH
jgi:hypothetical protein